MLREVNMERVGLTMGERGNVKRMRVFSGKVWRENGVSDSSGKRAGFRIDIRSVDMEQRNGHDP